MLSIVYLVPIMAVLAVFVWYKLRKLSNFFADRNIPYVASIWPFGSDVRGSFLQDNFGVSWRRIYKKLEPHKLGGFFFFLSPVLMIRDPDYVLKIMAADFVHFADRGFLIDEKTNPLDKHLFFLAGEKWRYIRQKLSPVFSSGKLKWMFKLMNGCSNNFVNNYLKTEVSLGEDVNMKEAYACYSTDIINSCAFGFESNSSSGPGYEFKENGRKFFEPSKWVQALFLAKFMTPKFLFFFKLKSVDPSIENFFTDVVQQAFKHRLSTGYSRSDLIQLLLEIREKGEVKSDELMGKTGNERYEFEDGLGSKTVEPLKIDDALLTSQLALFYLAGFENMTKTLMAATFLFSNNSECQEKARREVLSVLATSGGEFTYDSVARMTYLQMCLNETLRLLPPFTTHFRVCTKDYTFPDGTKIESGTSVVIPFHSIQMDPKHFPEPNKFIPERFEGQIHNGAFTPFGFGRRMCMGQRFAQFGMKLILAKLLAEYYVKPCLQKTDPYDWLPDTIIIETKTPLYVRLEKIEV